MSDDNEKLFRNNINEIQYKNNNIILNNTNKKYIKPINYKYRTIEEYINKGFIIINKPKGPTSHEVASFVKKILNIKKVGHSGSLDPKVTGLQLILLSKATKAVRIIRLAPKEYICILKLHKYTPEKNIRNIFQEFTDEIFQIPPQKSAIKRKLRSRKIYYMEIIEIENNNRTILFKVGCEAGTYIRKLCHDIGLALGVGGHMQELLRSKVGSFDIKDSITLQQLTDAYDHWNKTKNETKIRELIHPMEHIFLNIPKIIVKENTKKSLYNGYMLMIPGIISIDSNIKKNELIQIISKDNEIISISIALMDSEEILNSNKGIVAVPLSVFK